MQVSTEWWTTFFSGLVVETIGPMYPESVTRADADFIQKQLSLEPGACLLDVPCGEGRLSLELASRGFRLSGVDLTPPLIEAARSKAIARGLDVSFGVGDMRELAPSSSFDAALCFGNSFGYMNEADNARFLRAVAGALKPGGRFVLECPLVAETLSTVVVQNSWYRLGEMLFLRQAEFDHHAGRLNVEYTMQRGTQVETKSASYRLYTIRELIALHAESGLRVEVELGSQAGEPFRFGAHGLYLISRR